MDIKEQATTEQILALYETYAQDNRAYNGVVWQFPTALITINILFLNFLLDKPQLLLVVAIINFALIQALFKLSYNQGRIIYALQHIETRLREIYGVDMIPNFTARRGKILGLPSRFLIAYLLLALNIVFLVTVIISMLF